MSVFQPTTVGATSRQEQLPSSPLSMPQSENRHLLAPSAVPSRAESVQSFTMDNESEVDRFEPMPAGQKGRSLSEPAIPVKKKGYRGYESEDAYIAAFKEFLTEKEYFEHDKQLRGFYGSKTMEDYIKESGGWRTKSKEQRRKERDKQRLKGANRLPEVVEGEEESERVGEEDDVLEGGEEGRPKGLRKMSMGFSRVFTRRRTIT